MIKNKNQLLAELLASTEIIIPSLLGKSFRLENEREVYQVIGTRWRTQEIVLKESSSEKMRTMQEIDFLRMATSIDE